MFSFLVEGVCFPASLAFFGLAVTLLVGVLLGVSLVVDLLGLFLSFFSWMASTKSWRDSRWTMAFLLVEDLGSNPESTPEGGEGVDETLLGSLEAPPDLSWLGLAPGSTSRCGEGVDRLFLDLLVAPPDFSCSGLDPTLGPTRIDDEGVGGVLPDLLMAPPDLSCPKLDSVPILTSCEGGGVCESSWDPPAASSSGP